VLRGHRSEDAAAHRAQDVAAHLRSQRRVDAQLSVSQIMECVTVQAARLDNPLQIAAVRMGSPQGLERASLDGPRFDFD
jgi:hypothetical protein